MDTCEIEVSEDGHEKCGKPAPVVIRIKDRVTGIKVSIPVCRVHKADHDRKAARSRVKR